jgi:hypothetical protein
MKRLGVGDSEIFGIDARELWNPTECVLQSGGGYRIEVTEQLEEWRDWMIGASPQEGWLGSARVIEPLVRPFARAPRLPMYALVGAIDRDPATFFLAISIGSWQAVKDGPLECFANDWPGAYGNNRGRLRVTLYRIS